MHKKNYQKSMGGPCACESIRYVDCGLSVACIIVASAFVTCFEICPSMFGRRVAACPGMVWKEMNMGVALSLIRREDWIRCLMEEGDCACLSPRCIERTRGKIPAESS